MVKMDVEMMFGNVLSGDKAIWTIYGQFNFGWRPS